MDLEFFAYKNRKHKSHKIRSTLNPLFMRVLRRFFTIKNNEIYQEYIGGADFGLHRAGNKHIILVCNVQRRPKRMYVFDSCRNAENVTVLPIHSIQQKQY